MDVRQCTARPSLFCRPASLIGRKGLFGLPYRFGQVFVCLVEKCTSTSSLLKPNHYDIMHSGLLNNSQKDIGKMIFSRFSIFKETKQRSFLLNSMLEAYICFPRRADFSMNAHWRLLLKKLVTPFLKNMRFC